MTQKHVKIGAYEVIARSEIETMTLPLMRLIPGVQLEQWELYRQRYPHSFADGNGWIARYGCYLVRSEQHTVLIDTGAGSNVFGTGQNGKLFQELQEHGVRPEHIDLVFLTHLHSDHVGWNLTPDGQPSFPHARYLVHEADWAFFQRPDIQASIAPYLERCVTPLQKRGVLDLFNGRHEIAPGLTAIPTTGHTPGHCSLLVSSEGQQGLIVGDVLQHPAQCTEPQWCTLFDIDTEQAIATRRQFIEWVIQEDLPLAVDHFPGTGFGRIVLEHGKPYWQEG